MELEYANLSKNQEERLKDLEKQFNSEFAMDCYFMVMDRNK
jgi:hypothetical protein